MFNLFNRKAPTWRVEYINNRFAVSKHTGKKFLGEPDYKLLGLYDTLEEAKRDMVKYKDYPVHLDDDLNQVRTY